MTYVHGCDVIARRNRDIVFRNVVHSLVWMQLVLKGTTYHILTNLILVTVIMLILLLFKLIIFTVIVFRFCVGMMLELSP